jgi:hypothetical protein
MRLFTLLGFVTLASLSVAAPYGDSDIIVPLDEGRVVIQNPRFIRENISKGGPLVPELAFTLVNETSSSWSSIKLQFDMGGLCNGQPRQWAQSVAMSLGWMQDRPIVREFKDTVIPLLGQVDGCRTEVIKARLVSAQSARVRIDGTTGERVDLEQELQEIRAKQEAEAAVKAEAQRKAAEAKAEEEKRVAEAQAKKDAAEALRQKRLAAEQKRKEAEAAAKFARIQAEENARAAEERRKVREACAAVYNTTADMKIKDLTVKQEQQVRACQALGLYPPQ